MEACIAHLIIYEHVNDLLFCVQIRGANLPALQSAIQNWSAKAEKPFSGQGLSLGKANPNMSSDDMRNKRLQALATATNSGFTAGSTSGAASMSPNEEEDIETASEPFKFNDESMGMLQSMGFSENAAKRALASCRHLTTTDEQIAHAIEWLDANADAPDLNDPFDMETLKEPVKKLTAEEAQQKILQLRQQRAEKEKEVEREREIRRREAGQLAHQTAEEIRELQRKAQEEKRKREKELVAREALRQRLELAKDKAERESRQHGQVSEATAKLIKELQDQWDGKDVTLSPRDPKAKVEGLISGLSLQKSDNAGSNAIKIVELVLKNVLKDPSEEKYRRIPWESGKKVYDTIAKVVGGVQLMQLIGWNVEEENGSRNLVLPVSADLEITKHVIQTFENFRNQGKL